MKTYQYEDPSRADPTTNDGTRLAKWVAANSEDEADQYAFEQGWNPCGGRIFDDRKTAELLDSEGWGGIDVVVNKIEYMRHFKHCGTEWSDPWTCACNDECPKCGKEIEPYDYDETIDVEVLEKEAA